MDQSQQTAQPNVAQPQNTVPPPPQPPTKKGSPLKWLLILLVFLVAIATGVYIFVLPKNDSKTSQALPTQTIAPSPTPTLDPTANWKTYTNNQLNFTFQYPVALFFKETKEKEYLAKDSLLSINITHEDCNNSQESFCGVTNSMYIDVKNSDGLSLDAWLKQNVLVEETVPGTPIGKFCYENGRAKQVLVTISGINTISYMFNWNQMGHPAKCVTNLKYNEQDPEKLQEIYFEKNGNVYVIDRRYKEGTELEKSFDQILSTFQFFN